MKQSQLLDEFLKRNQETEKSYRNNLPYIHVPMSLTALYFMGANEAQLRAYNAAHESYKAQIINTAVWAWSKSLTMFNKPIITEDNWKNYLGYYRYFPEYIKFFQ